MISIAEESLKDVELSDADKPGFKRFIRKEPLGLLCLTFLMPCYPVAKIFENDL